MKKIKVLFSEFVDFYLLLWLGVRDVRTHAPTHGSGPPRRADELFTRRGSGDSSPSNFTERLPSTLLAARQRKYGRRIRRQRKLKYSAIFQLHAHVSRFMG